MHSIIWEFDIVGEQLATYARMSNISQGVCALHSTMLKNKAVTLLKMHTEDIREVAVSVLRNMSARMRELNER